MAGAGGWSRGMVGAMFAPERQTTFLEALAETANFRLASAAAGVSIAQSAWARKRDPEFAARCAEAQAIARDRLFKARQDEGETVVRRDPSGRLQRRVARPGDWTEADDERFLSALIEHANVTKAAYSIGKNRNSAYGRRRADPVFRQRWDAALDDAVAGLEWALVAQANAALQMPERDGDMPDPGAKAAASRLAMDLLKLQLARRAGGGKRGGQPPRARDLGAVRDSVLEKLAAIERHRSGA